MTLPNGQHERFAQEIAKGTPQTEAYVKAGYRNSPSGASRLAKNAQVKARISEIQSKIENKTVEKTSDLRARVLQELERIGFSDVRGVVNWKSNVTEIPGDEKDPDADRDPDTGEVLPKFRSFNEVTIIDADKITPDMAAAIAEVSQTKDGMLKLKLHPKLPALNILAEHVGLKDPDKAAPFGEVHHHNHVHFEMTDEQRIKAMAFLMYRNADKRDEEAA